ncbi:MAG: DNA sulfur modification protein DndD [Sulfurimonadaceae bacterium]|jgi:DNA sulfur modification protein DndD|nr:DNA sulfur modification protein DndD [Sulfurimonadaceae bacterium]
MKIKSIEISNMFSYYGRNKIDFDLSDDSKNINIIYGRNGNGKTSFINSIKLLFLGTQNPLYSKQLRKSVSENGTIALLDYVVGNKNWYGILNKKAKSEAENSFFISIDFFENNKIFTTKREWSVKNGDYDEKCTIFGQEDNFELSGIEAEKFLHKRIPPDFVDFFFFDGEQIQQIAEANRTDRKEKIVKLLNISGIEFISKILRKYKDDLQNQSYENKSYQQKIIESKNNIEDLQRKIELIETKLTQYNNEIDEIEEEKIKYENRKKDIYINGNQKKASELDTKKSELEKRLFDLKNNSLSNILSTSFLTFKSSLINKIKEELASEIKKTKELDNIDFANTLINTLPKQLFEDAPKIDIPEDKKEQLKNKLEKLLALYKVDDKILDNQKNYLESLSHSQLVNIQSSLSRLLDKSKQHKNLIEIKEINTELKAIEFELKIINDDPEEQKELSRLEQLINKSNTEIEEKRRLMHDQEKDIGEHKLKIKSLETDIFRLDSKAKKNFHLDPQIKLSEKIINILKDYKENLEKNVKQEVENYLNENYRQLIDSNNLIRSIKIEDDFNINCFDENKELIGMSSISAGMKQMVAISLLWALKETTNRTIPVIIDTPLGRIDYKNQINILKNYYPNASSQVIILPTDSEIDNEKFKHIEKNVAAIYELKNVSGVETKINKINEIEKEVFNG